MSTSDSLPILAIFYRYILEDCYYLKQSYVSKITDISMLKHNDPVNIGYDYSICLGLSCVPWKPGYT